MADRTQSLLKRLEPSVYAEPVARGAFRRQVELAVSQFRPRELLETYQLERLQTLGRFAARETAYGRACLDVDRMARAASLAEALAALPVLSREKLRDEGESLHADNLPQGHDRRTELSSSGSTGMVVRLPATNIWVRWQRSLGLRSHIWAGREFRRSLAIIRRQDPGRAIYPAGARGKRWGALIDFPFPTGPGYLLNAYTSLDLQWEWLKEIRPSYLLTLPSILRSFLQRHDVAELGLQGLSTLGEVVDEDLRSLAREKLNLPIHDLYSSEEAGVMAIQCPDAPAYHVQGEAIILEVLDEGGAPCRPGEVGRVVVTPLHNFAAPLLRYDLNDFAEAAAPCSCGRGLPTLGRIMGRRRNILVTSDGKQHWPALRTIHDIVKIRAHQYRQVAPDAIEVWLAVDSPVTAEQEEKMRTALRDGILGNKGVIAPFDFRFRYVSEFPRNPNGKHEEFVSLVGTPAVSRA
jgi:phenylacetate-CoA ligase